MNRSLQIAGLYCLTGLGAVLLILIGLAFAIMGTHIGDDGRVPAAEAFGLTALLLSFREVIGGMKGLYDHEERAITSDKLANANPSGTQAVEVVNSDPIPVDQTEAKP